MLGFRSRRSRAVEASLDRGMFGPGSGSMSEPLQHYVPKFMLRRFSSGARELVHAFDKHQDKIFAFSTSKKSKVGVAAERAIYDLTLRRGGVKFCKPVVGAAGGVDEEFESKGKGVELGLDAEAFEFEGGNDGHEDMVALGSLGLGG